MFRDGHLTTTGERGICVSTSPSGWRVEKRGSSSVGAGPMPFQQGRQPPGILSSHGSWWQEPGGDSLKDTRLVMEVADDGLVNLVNTQNHKNQEVMGVVRK